MESGTTTPAELEEIGAHIDARINAAYHRLGCSAPTRNGRPVLQMLGSYEREVGEEDYEIWREAFAGFMAILWQEGPSPEVALKRLMALTWAVAREHLAGMNQTELAMLTHETKAAWSQRIQTIYSDYLRSRGFRGTRVPGQKSESAREAYKQRAEGNTNRASGRKKGDAARPTSKSQSKNSRP